MTAMASSMGEEVGWESALDSACPPRRLPRLRAAVPGILGTRVRIMSAHDAGSRPAAEDCTQETFINAWRALDRFETRSAFGTWLHRIAVNVVLGKRRRVSYSARRRPSSRSIWRRATGPSTPRWKKSEIEAAIAKLPEGARDVLVLSGIYGYSHLETADDAGSC